MYSSFEAPQHHDGYFSGKDLNDDELFWWDDAHRQMYNDFRNRYLAGKKGILLDVGCGLGFFVKMVSDTTSWQAFGYELSPEAVSFGRDRLGIKAIYCGKIEEAEFERNSFDIITLWDVIEHIPDPGPMLASLKSLLREDGFLFLHTPNANIQLFKARLKRLVKGMRPGGHYLEAKDHVNIYTPDSIRRVLACHGFPRLEFTHLLPLRSVSGSRNAVLVALKNAWYYFSKALFSISKGRINLYNLHVLAKT